MKITAKGRTEFSRFDAAVKKLLGVSYEELQRRISTEEKTKKGRKAVKPSTLPAFLSRVRLDDGLFFAVLADQFSTKIETKALFVEVAIQMETYVPRIPRFRSNQKFSIPFV